MESVGVDIHHGHMAPEPQIVASMLSLAGLVAGTGEYSHMIRRRAEGQRADEEAAAQEALEADALRGLVRVLAVDDEPPPPRDSVVNEPGTEAPS